MRRSRVRFSSWAPQTKCLINLFCRIELILVHMQKQALIVSYSKISSDPRVLRQINWLKASGYEIVTVGLGELRPNTVKVHCQIKVRSLPLRLFSYLLFNGRLRYIFLFKQINKNTLKTIDANNDFNVVVFNDLDLLPFAHEVKQLQICSRLQTHFHLDLHEYFPDHGIGFVWQLLFKQYVFWLLTQIHPTSWDSVSTVSPSLAKLYEQSKIFDSVASILSTPKRERLPITQCSESRINLVYHGAVDLNRGLNELVDAVQNLDNRFHLNLVLVGSARKIMKLRKRAKINSERIHFWDPVPTEDIAKLINRFDIEVIFYIPTSLNLLHAMPNKYFEATQANLAILHGQSPSMEAMSKRFGNGILVEDWTYNALTDRLNNLSADEINSLKASSLLAGEELCSEVEGYRFLELVEGSSK